MNIEVFIRTEPIEEISQLFPGKICHSDVALISSVIIPKINEIIRRQNVLHKVRTEKMEGTIR